MKRISLNEEQNNPVEVARRIPHPRDPPGQRSIYITPGKNNQFIILLFCISCFKLLLDARLLCHLKILRSVIFYL